MITRATLPLLHACHTTTGIKSAEIAPCDQRAVQLSIQPCHGEWGVSKLHNREDSQRFYERHNTHLPRVGFGVRDI